MATPLPDVYRFFLAKVKDYKFIQLNKEGVLEDVLFNHLVSAIVRFTNCVKDLNVDELTNSFVSDLDLDEKEILSQFMLLSYTTGKIMDVKNLEQDLTEREFKKYSQANHLDKLLSLESRIQSNSSQLLNSYSLKHYSLEDFD